MIKASHLQKSYLIYKKKSGLAASLKSLFYREYRKNIAVDSFDLSIKRGEIVGLLGPNGAGKTTLMKMFTGIVVPSEGELTVLGFKPHERKREFRKQIALVMGQKSQLWWDIPAMDSLELLKRYYEIEEKVFQDRVHHLANLLGVQKLLDVHVRKLSLGERMKMELMASLLHSPQVIFLDEPTIGLDLVAQENIRKFLQDYHRQHNITMVLTSHYMADVEALCERVVLLLDGKKRFDGSIDTFEKVLGKEKYVSFHFSEPLTRNLEYFAQFDAEFKLNSTQVELRIPEERMREVGAHILQHYPVSDFYSEKLPIERVMKSLMQQPELLGGQ